MSLSRILLSRVTVTRGAVFYHGGSRALLIGMGAEEGRGTLRM